MAVYRDFFGNIVPQSATPTNTVTGSAGSEPLAGTAAADLLIGGGAGHAMTGLGGDDTYQINYIGDSIAELGGEGLDTVQVRNVKLYSLAQNVENFFLFGKMTGYGNDLDNLIVGNINAQTIAAGAGNDVIVGGAGADIFVFGANSGYDAVTDFNSAQSDKIRIQDYGFMNFGQVVSAMTQVGADVVLQLSTTDAVRFQNKTIGSFQASDFQLASDTSNLRLTFSAEFDAPLSYYDSDTGTGVWKPSYSTGDQSGPRAYSSHTLRNNNEKELYVDPSFVGSGDTPLGLDPFAVEQGVLTITATETTDAEKEDLWYYKYKSGLLTTQPSFSQTYGYFEIRADLPAGQGVWPAFWLLPTTLSSPPELDVFEQIGDDKIYFTSHSAVNGVIGTTAVVAGATTGFHTYGVLWTNKELTWYVDGGAVASIATPADMDKPMYMLVNLAIGGGFPGNPTSDFTTADLKVDYIRAYSIDAGGGIDGDLGVSVAKGVIGSGQKDSVAFTVTGLDAGATGVVTFMDDLQHTVVVHVSANGVGTADLSSLMDGEIAVMVAANDVDGGALPGVGETFTIDPTIDSGLKVSVPFNLGDAGKAAATFTVSGLEPGSQGLVTFADTLNQTITASVSADGPLTVDLTGLADGTINVTITETDGLGATLTGLRSRFALDSTADDLGDLTVAVSPYANAQNSGRFTFSHVGLDKDSAAEVTFTDSEGHTVVARLNNNSSPFVNLNGLTDGQVTATITVIDDAGNTASGLPVSLTLDRIADQGGDLAVSLAADLVDAAGRGAVAFTVSGLDADATALVTFTDGVGQTVVVAVPADGDGVADLSALADGPITVAIEAEDLAGNSAAGVGDSLTLDATADLGGDLNVTLASDTANASDRAAVAFTVSGLDADASAVVTFTDSADQTVTANIAADGSASADLTSLADGPITVTITATDAAGNTASGAGDSLALDSTADADADLAVSVADTANAADRAAVAFTVSGLDADASAVVTFTDSADQTVTANIAADGSASADLSALADGPITVTVAATDAAGNTATGAGDSLTLDATADVATDLALSVADTANAADRAAVAFTVSGLDADASAVVTFTDSASQTITANVAADGAFTADLTVLADGPITVLIEATDAVGNIATGSGDSLTLDVIADAGADLSVAVADTANAADRAAVAFTVSGLDADASAVVTFTDSADQTVTANIAADGSASADLTSLADGPITVTIAATDAAGNTATGAGDSLALDSTADAGADLAVSVADTANAADRAAVAFTVSGLDADASAVVTFTDSADQTVTANIAADGSATADLSALSDGPITVTIAATDTSGNTATGAGDSLTLDATADVAADLAVSVADTANAADRAAVAFTVSGLDADASAVVTFTDSADQTVTANIAADGSASADLSALADGPITVTVAATDAAGNTATGAGDSLALDSTADAGADLAVSVADTANAADRAAVAFTVSGLDADASAVVTFTDSADQTVTANIAADGSATADLSALADGPITVTVAATDAAGNTATGAVDSLTLDATADVAADLAVSVADTANAADRAAVAFTVSGLDADASAVVTFTDSADQTVTANIAADGSATADLTSLADGPITVTVAATDAAGNTATGAVDSLTLDATADVAADLAVSVADTANAADRAAVAFTVSGLDADASAVVTFTDSADQTVTANIAADGSATADLSALADGPITVTVVATDTAGNTASGAGDSLTLDATADAGADLAVSVADTANAADRAAVAFTVSGLDADASAVVTFTDSADQTVTANIAADGSASADLTSLADGPITVTVAATDAAGNTASGAGDSLTLDATADVGGDLAVSVAPSAPDAAAVAFTVAGLDADAGAVVTFTDGASLSVAVTVGANGDGVADLSGLAAGSITVTIAATDGAGNTATGAGDSLILDDGDTTADVGGDLAVVLAAHTANAADREAVAFAVLGLDPDATAVVTFTDGAAQTVTATIAANGSASADLSALADGPITVTIKATDAVGNTATGAGDSLTLDSTADAGGDLAVSLSLAAVNIYEKTYVPFVVAGLDAGAAGVITFTDRLGQTVSAAASNGAARADISSLAAGLVEVTVTATDAAGNVATSAAAALTLAPGVIEQIRSSQVIIASPAGGPVTGTAANDLIVAGAGDDVVNGGGGSNTVSYNGAGSAVTVSIAAGLQTTQGSGKDSLTAVQNLVGSAFGDTLKGDGGANLLGGGGGADNLNGGNGDDVLVGGAGDDTLTGGSGVDTASYADAVSAVTVNLALTTAQDTGGAGIDKLATVENLVGSDFGDTLIGSSKANRLVGSAGDDVLTGGGDNDILDGGAGNNTAAYDDTSGGIKVNLSISGAQNTGRAGTDTLISIQNLRGTAFADTLTGDDAANRLMGGDGADTLSGAGGDDDLQGGAGNDLLDGGAGQNLLDGGDGFDTVSYAGAAAGLTLSLSAAGFQATGVGADRLVNIERLIGGAFADQLTGAAVSSTLEGGLGDDTLTGLGGADTLLGGDGADVLEGGGGADLLNGGSGQDTASYAGAGAGVTVSLAITTAQDTVGAGVDTLAAIENLTGSAQGDTLTGSTGNNIIDGGAGADVINAGAGKDVIIGGAGTDTLTGGGSADTFVFKAVSESAAGAADTITDFSRSQGDKLDLSAIDADTGVAGDQGFTFLGSAAFGHHAGELRVQFGGGVAHVYGDVDGDGVADFELTLTAVTQLQAADVIL